MLTCCPPTGPPCRRLSNFHPPPRLPPPCGGGPSPQRASGPRQQDIVVVMAGTETDPRRHALSEQSAAYHEAGHAVAAAVQHRRFQAVRLTDTGAGGLDFKTLVLVGRDQHPRGPLIFREVRICLAGFVAGRQPGCGDNGWHDQFPLTQMALFDRCGEDWRNAWTLARLAVTGGAMGAATAEDRDVVWRCLEDQQQITIQLLKNNWPSVQAIACCLDQERQLSWARVRQVMKSIVPRCV